METIEMALVNTREREKERQTQKQKEKRNAEDELEVSRHWRVAKLYFASFY